MKKLLSVIAVGFTVLACIPFTASADNEENVKLPFEVTPPENVTLTYLDKRDSLNTCEIHYSQNNSMSEWSSRKADAYDEVMAELEKEGYGDIWIDTQIDWSLDSQDDWKCNDYWLTGGYDKDYVQHLGDWAYISETYSPETAMDEWIFRYMGNIDDPEDFRWYGRHQDGDDYDGWGDVLKEGQYKISRTENESLPWIDFSEHTMYVRVRWLVTVRPLEGDDIHIPSGWSEVAAVGKDVEKIEALKPGDVAPPKISDVEYSDEEFNGYPVIGFKLEVTPEAAKQAAQVNGTAGVMWLYTEARVVGSPGWAELQGDIDVTSGQVWIALQNIVEAEGRIEKDTPIQLRAKYYVSQAGEEDFYSDYSDIITFGSMKMEVTTEKVEDTTAAPETAETTATAAVTTTKEEKDKCKVCGICPQPLGICLFILIAIILVIIGGIVAAVLIMKKKEKTGDSKPEAPQAPPVQDTAQQEAPQTAETAEAPADNDDSGKNA